MESTHVLDCGGEGLRIDLLIALLRTEVQAMPISVECQGCGRKFQAPEELAGKRAKCPKCSPVIQVRAGPATPSGQVSSAEDSSQAIPVTCGCGKKFRAKAELAGKRVQCPACGQALAIPRFRPAAGTAPTEALDLDEAMRPEMPAPAVREPLRRAAPPKKRAEKEGLNVGLIVSLSVGTGVAILARAGAAFAVSFPAFILGALIAANWLPGPFPTLGELPVALPSLAVVASVLGLPGAFLGGCSGSWRAWYAWVITPVVSAAISGFSCVAVCLFSRTSLLDPVTFTIIFGLTIAGFFSGLASHVVAASLQSPARQESGDRRRQNGVAAPSQVQTATMRRAYWPGFGLLVVGAVYVAMSLAALLPLITDPGPAVPSRHAPIGLVVWAIQPALGIVMIIGGSKMRNLKGYRYALAAAIAAIVPISCFFLALPVGLWALVVLLDARVKAAFRD